MKIRKIKGDDFNQYQKLREASLEHYSKLMGEKLEITLDQIEKEFSEILSKPKRVIFVAEKDKEIIGFIIGTSIKNPYQPSVGYIDDLFVKKDSRRKGFGKKLVVEFMDWSKSKGATKIRLGVDPDNKKAIALYKKMDFEVKHYEMEKELE